MEITKDLLEKLGACKDAREWVASKQETDLHKLYELAKQEQHLDWANWLIARLLLNDDKIRYAVFAAEMVLSIFENWDCEDDRPRKAIEAAKGYLHNKIVVYAAACAAYDAACAAANAAAYAAANAAANAAYAAANAAANAAAYATAYATYATAYAAACAANAVNAANAAAKNWDTTMIEILDYGIELLK